LMDNLKKDQGELPSVKVPGKKKRSRSHKKFGGEGSIISTGRIRPLIGNDGGGGGGDVEPRFRQTLETYEPTMGEERKERPAGQRIGK